jgi:hypothetical protein
MTLAENNHEVHFENFFTFVDLVIDMKAEGAHMVL